MKSGMMVMLLVLVCSSLMAGTDTGDAETAAVAESGSSLATLLRGRWEGTIFGSLRQQNVSWRFEQMEDGKLLGYMGVEDAGLAGLAMDDLQVDAEHIRFRIKTQHASYEGTVRDGVISGSWLQGVAVPLQMKKKTFVFALPIAMHDRLLGRWETQYNSSTMSLGPLKLNYQTPFLALEFTDQGNALVAGTMQVYKTRSPLLPLLDIYAKEDGYLSVSADGKRSFSGTVVGNVLYGDYKADKTQRSLTLTRSGHGDDLQNLALTDEQFDKLSGSWERTEGRFGAGGYHFFRTDAGQLRGELMLDRLVTSKVPDPLVLVEMQGNHVVFVSVGGRVFTGDLSGEGLIGQYHTDRQLTAVKLAKQQPAATEVK